MNVLSNMEEHWRRFPELQRLFTNASLGNDFYHHGGLRSPYTTVIDDLHDLATIVAIVGRGEELIRTAARRAATEEPAEYVARMRRLVSELDHLALHLHSFTEGFLRERIKELRQQQDVIYRALSQAREDEYRSENRPGGTGQGQPGDSHTGN
jgi:hypothetical protein